PCPSRHGLPFACTFSPPDFLHHPATPEIYTLSLHALFRSRVPVVLVPYHRHANFDFIEKHPSNFFDDTRNLVLCGVNVARHEPRDRKSTRLNSSHEWTSYAVFCLEKKKNGH